MKKAIFVIIISVVLTAVIFVTTQRYFGTADNTGELQITSQPQAKVYLEDQYIGDTPLCRCEGSHGGVLPVRDYTVKLIPKTGSTSPFFEHISITKGVLTVIDHSFAGPGQSSGSTLELTPDDISEESSLFITSFPSDATVMLDDNEIGNTPVSSKNPTSSDHTITVKKNGYEDKTLHINTPKGYKLQAIVYLAVNIQSQSTASQSAKETATSSAVLTPSPVIAKVTILDTPTGFLRVRADASLGSPEVGQVKPGDSLYLLDEKVGWYEVKLSDSKIGWISSQYAQKNQ